VDKAYANLDTVLVAAGGSRRDVAKPSALIVRCGHEDKWLIIKAAHATFFGEATTAWTVVGVERLARPDLPIEVEATTARD
jgi:enamine deaminase RidA (YjgF/YER057c/UK114 family)